MPLMTVCADLGINKMNFHNFPYGTYILTMVICSIFRTSVYFLWRNKNTICNRYEMTTFLEFIQKTFMHVSFRRYFVNLCLDKLNLYEYNVSTTDC